MKKFPLRQPQLLIHHPRVPIAYSRKIKHRTTTTTNFHNKSVETAYILQRYGPIQLTQNVIKKN